MEQLKQASDLDKLTLMQWIRIARQQVSAELRKSCVKYQNAIKIKSAATRQVQEEISTIGEIHGEARRT